MNLEAIKRPITITTTSQAGIFFILVSIFDDHGFIRRLRALQHSLIESLSQSLIFQAVASVYHFSPEPDWRIVSGAAASKCHHGRTRKRAERWCQGKYQNAVSVF
jgi:hypothetical protein